MLVPKLRFKREDGTDFPEWETRQLHNVFVERNETQTIAEDAPLLSFTIEQGVINPEDKKTNKRDFLIKDKDNKKYALTEYNDIIYNPANLKFGAIHRNKLGRGVVSPIYAIFHTGENPIFMEYIVTNPVFIKKSLKYLEGTVIKLMTLKPRDFLLMKCNIPCLEEQQKIADFLSTVDEVIAQSEAEVQNLEQQKKAVMQKIFSQEVRFKREDGTDYPEWEEKALSDISEIITKGTTPKKYSENGDINFVQINSIVDGAINTDKCLRIDEETHNGFLSRSVLFENDILCSIAGALGVIAVVNKDVLPANTNQALAIIRLNEGCNHRYIAFALSSYVMEKYIKQCKTVGAQPNLSLAQIRDMIVPFPCYKEQQKIADFLSAYDEAISYAKQELDKWKELKKGLLQQMFV